ncbi:hypothetical protein Hdeb2414_s0026g00680931 [Helianthus debilis subsp. tardiflorus]
MAATVVLCSCLGSRLSSSWARFRFGSVGARLGTTLVRITFIGVLTDLSNQLFWVIALVRSLEISDLTRALLTRNRNATNVDVDDAWNLVGCLDTHLKICILIVLFHYSGYCILFQNLVIDSLEME